MATLIASVPLALLIFLRTHLADRDRSRLLARSEQSIGESETAAAQIVQSEKLVSLGQLAAARAHEINNPLARSSVFRSARGRSTVPEKARITASKIRDQARRTKTLVGNLLEFCAPGTGRAHALDNQYRCEQRVSFGALDLRSGTTRIELQLESVLPGVRGDGNQ